MKNIILTNKYVSIDIFSSFDTEIYKSFETDAGFDICSPVNIIINPFSFCVIDTGLSLKFNIIDNNNDFLYYAQVKGRSGLSINNSIEVSNAGVIDQDYTGNINIKLYNLGNKEYVINKYDRIAQLIIFQIPKLVFFDGVRILNNNISRKSNGLGSSGK